MKSRLLTTSVLLATLVAAVPAQAGGLTTGLREAAEYIGKKLGRDVAEEGAERVATRLTRQAAKYGDEGAVAIMKHGTVGEQLVGQFGKEGAEALAKVAPQNGRRLAMLAAQGQLEPGLMDVIAKHGDQACEFIWRNKGALAVGTTLTAFVANPQAFIDGTQKLSATVADAAVKPFALGVANNTNWTLVGLVLTAVLVALAYPWIASVRKGISTTGSQPASSESAGEPFKQNGESNSRGSRARG
jgi:hypothetical protein